MGRLCCCDLARANVTGKHFFSDDANSLQGSRALPFVDYLRAVIAGGGFYAAPPDDERKDEALAALAVLKQGRIAF